MSPRYRMVIDWSEEDGKYLAWFPEWSGRVLGYVAHGDTYEAAARNGQLSLRLLIESAQASGEDLPPTHDYVSEKDDIVGLAEARRILAAEAPAAPLST